MMPNTPVYPWEIRGFHSWYGAVRAHQFCDREMTRFLKPLGLTTPQYELLANIAADPGTTQQDLSDCLAIAKSNVSTVLATLEKKGLVNRQSDPADKRVRRLSLTEKAEKLLPAAFKCHAELVNKMMQHLSDAEIEIMGRAVDGVLRSFGCRLKEGIRP